MRTHIKSIFFLLLSLFLSSCGDSADQPVQINLQAPTKAISGELVVVSAQVINANGAASIEWSIEGNDNIELVESSSSVSFRIPIATEASELVIKANLKAENGSVIEKKVSIDIPKVEISFTTSESPKILKNTVIEAHLENILADEFNIAWQVGGTAVSDNHSLTLNYTPKLTDQNSDIAIQISIADLNGHAVTGATSIEIPEVQVAFDVPFTPVSLRYVDVNAVVSNLEQSAVSVSWEITNEDSFVLQNSDSFHVRFLAEKQLSKRDEFPSEQRVELKMTVSDGQDSLTFPTSITVAAVETLPEWPKHVITATNPMHTHSAKFYTNKTSPCAADANNQVKKIDFNNDGFDDYFCSIAGDLIYYQSQDATTFLEPIKLTHDSRNRRIQEVQFFDLNKNNNLEFYLVDVFPEPSVETFSLNIKKWEVDNVTGQIVSTNSFKLDKSFSAATTDLSLALNYAQLDDKFYTLLNTYDGGPTKSCELYQLDIVDSSLINLQRFHDIGSGVDCIDVNYSSTLNDIDEDGQNELIITGEINTFGGPPSYLMIAIKNEVEPVASDLFCSEITRENIDSDDQVEWICYSGGWQREQKNLVTLVEGELRPQILEDYSKDLFFGQGERVLQKDRETDGVDIISFTTFYDDGYTSSYLKESYIFYAFNDQNNKILLTKYGMPDDEYSCCVKGIPSTIDNIEFVDMDGDGDIDVKVEGKEEWFWLENVEALPIVTPH